MNIMVLLISLLQFISLCGPFKQNANSFTFQLFDSQDQHVCFWKSSRFPLVFSRFDPEKEVLYENPYVANVAS